MKRTLSIILVFAMLLSCSVIAFAEVAGGGTNRPVTVDEIQKGTIIAFDFEEGDFDTDTYYVKILGVNGAEYTYALAGRVYVGNSLYKAEEVADMDFGEITYVLRSGNVKYINPTMPDGLFESVAVKYCHRENDKIYVTVEFVGIVGEFKLIMAAYSGDMLCSVKSFDISYTDSCYELDMEANGGYKVKIFFWENKAGLVPVYEAVADYIPAEYGYLISVNEADGGYEFEMLTDEGEIVSFDCAEKIAIDDEIEPLSNITTLLKSSAKGANAAYEDEENATYSQIVMYALNEMGEVARIDTVGSVVNKKISKVMDEGAYYSPYGYKQFEYKDKSFGDFSVSDDTLIFFAPDDRSDKDEYLVYKGYKALRGTKIYHVEAYGLSEDKVASVVVMYKDNGKNVYTYNSPAMIVNNKIKSGDEAYITGYTLTSYSLKRVKVDTAEVEHLSGIGKGDIIRYITNSSNEMVDYKVWFDADNSVQQTGCASMAEAIENRILEINATSIDPVQNYPNASFRLQYGTVSDIALTNDGNSITVTPVIKKDSIAEAGTDGTVEWEIERSVKIFEYTPEGVSASSDLTDIIPGESEVIAYSSGGKLGMLYIIAKPYVSEKKIAVLQSVTERAAGYDIIGYGDSGRLIATVNEADEPIVTSLVPCNVIAYVTDGDTIKDIEVVFGSTKDKFEVEAAESLISTDTLESLIFGLAEYTQEGAIINGVEYTVGEDTNYNLMKYAGNIVNYGLGKHMEMKGEYVLIRVKADIPTHIADVVIFQDLN
ncbi:MAG: hypothetical protein IKU60_05575 [Clostridia bacterium]|nr:hypothetical protein [Clostridia bacterium]